MNRDENKCTPTPRQYRPTYSYLASTTSMPHFTSPVKPTLPQPPQSHKRRRVMSAFPVMDLLHSAPTVAPSSLTASVSSNDISHPPSKQYRLSLKTGNQKLTRIPTPTSGAKSSSQMHIFHSPASSQKLKENVAPATHRLLGPIQPGPVPTGGLSKARTMNMLSSFASPFTNTLTSSRASLGNISAHIISTPSTSLPLPTLISNVLQVSALMPVSYWLGRFQGLHDHFRAENLSQGFLDSPIARKWMHNEDENAAGDGSESADRYEEFLSKRCFIHLDTLCLNNEAKKSLRAFQQAYARKMDCVALLPLGGSMVDKESGLMAKAGRLFSTGRKGSFGMMGKKRSMLGLRTVDLNT